MTANSHGLSRNIPASVKLEVRQRCGFGCIRCAACIYEYDHFDPEFSDATEHRAEGITLLCPTCHALKTKGVLTTGIIAQLDKNPFARSGNSPTITLPHFEGFPTVRLGGGFLIQNTPIPLRVRDVPVLEFSPPENGSTVIRVNALLSSADDKNLLRISDNEWIVESGAWDFEWVGQRISIRDDVGEALRLTVEPPHFIGVDRLRANLDGHRIEMTATEVRVDNKLIVGMTINSCPVGLQVGRPDNPDLMKAGGGMMIG